MKRPALGLRIALAASFSAALLAPSVRAEEVVRSYTVSARAGVRVDTDDGSVRVTASDSNRVEFRVEYKGYVLDKDLSLQSRQDGNTVELTTRVSGQSGISWGRDPRSVRIEVRMPLNADLQVTTGDGSVKAESLTGRVDLRTEDGSITADKLKGDIRLRTEDGAIDARALDGKVDAESGDGRVRLAGRFEALRVKTGDGSVDAQALPGSQMTSGWDIETGDGSVRLALPVGFQADLDATTDDGRITLGLPVTVEGRSSGSQVHGRINGGGQPLSIHTGDGSIRLGKS
jgi:hypothetical protein